MAAVTGNDRYSLNHGINSVNEQLRNIIDEFPYINKNKVQVAGESSSRATGEKSIEEERLEAVAKWMKMKELKEKSEEG